MYKLNFTLKQHTPLIHFQHDQEGATLRASEVKPKLDKFLLSQIGNGDCVSGCKIANEKGWLVGNGDHPALDYKLKILPVKTMIKYFYTSNPHSEKYDAQREELIKNEFDAVYVNQTQYFANNENLKQDGIKEKNKVKLGTITNHIDCQIIYFNKEIRNILKPNIGNFFLSYNFGCRQTKGFGCFTIVKIDGSALQFEEDTLVKQFDIVYKVNAATVNFNDALRHIASIYTLLKSGKGKGKGKGEGEHGGYKKSLLFRYFISLPSPIRWEKRKIKQTIREPYFKYKKQDGSKSDIKLTYQKEPCLDLTNANRWNDSPTPYNYKYIRALLGLAECFEFLADDIERTRFKYYMKVKPNNGIERFQSPIIFKYISSTIYICSNAINTSILNSRANPVSFNFDKGLKIDNRLQINSYIATDVITNLETPSDFNIGDFFDFAFRRDSEKINGITCLKNTLIK